MRTREIKTKTEYGGFKYEAVNGGAALTEYCGDDITLTIPVNIESLPIKAIGKKAFLGAGELKELVLPENIEVIQDWAFAACRKLETVTLPRREIKIGQGIFKDCDKLSRVIRAGDETREDEEVSYLLAAAMNGLDAFYLFDLQRAGSAEWLRQWDARLGATIAKEDAEGFSRLLLCGEEDYGSRDNDFDYYVETRRRFKVRLAMLRLMKPTGLEPDFKEFLLNYLIGHTKGAASEETWRVVLDEHGDERAYYEFLLDNGCITKENIDAVLADMGGRHTEMKAFLINYANANFKKGDIFEALRF